MFKMHSWKRGASCESRRPRPGRLWSLRSAGSLPRASSAAWRMSKCQPRRREAGHVADLARFYDGIEEAGGTRFWFHGVRNAFKSNRPFASHFLGSLEASQKSPRPLSRSRHPVPILKSVRARSPAVENGVELPPYPGRGNFVAGRGQRTFSGTVPSQTSGEPLSARRPSPPACGGTGRVRGQPLKRGSLNELGAGAAPNGAELRTRVLTTMAAHVSTMPLTSTRAVGRLRSPRALSQSEYTLFPPSSWPRKQDHHR